MPEHPTDAHFSFTFVFKQALRFGCILKHNIQIKLNSLVWFGLYICPTKPKPIYGWAKEKVGMDVGVATPISDFRV